MILRELIAVFGLDYDSKGEKQAEKGIDKLKKKWGELRNVGMLAAGAAAAAAPLLLLAKMGSDAQEVMNLLNVTFEDNADTISSWARETGPRIGRSINLMTELAAEFGGLLRPMVGANDELAEMSTNLAEVAVDLSSLRNITEKEAMEALRSGLSGSTIAVRRFGVDLRMARIEAEAFRMGINKSTTDMTQGELAAIRYRLIMKDLAFVQGDAAKTQWDFANSSRAFRDDLFDLGTALGMFLVPAFEDLLKIVRSISNPMVKLVENFNYFNKNTNLAQGVLLALGITAAAVLIPSLLGILLPLVPLILAMGLFAMVMDDVITTFQGGESAINTATAALDKLEKDGFAGLNPAVEWAVRIFNGFRDVLGAVGVAVAGLIESIITWNPNPFLNAIRAIKDSFLEWIKPLRDAWSLLEKMSVSEGVGKLKGFVERNIIGVPAPGGSTVAPPSPTGGPGQVLGGEAGRRAITVNREGSQLTFNVYQQPGESSEDFAKRVKTIIDEEGAARDQAIQAALAPEPAG